jgi:triacylglycerol esterase/lipase EstA (alpha/beta hydrolase family)
MYSYGFSVWNSEWTNSATHSGPLQQLVTMNCVETPSAANRHLLLFFRCPTSYQRLSAVCLLWLFFACIQLSVLKASEVKKNLVFIGLGKINPSYWQNDKKNPTNAEG